MITSLLRNASPKSKQAIAVKKQFLNDLIHLCANSRENRRTVLQMSVWQEFLIGLAHVYPIDADELEITDLVFKVFKVLLHHAIKFEYGGWRVWIDTLSILHSRVSKEDYQLKMSKLYEDYEKAKESSAQSANGPTKEAEPEETPNGETESQPKTNDHRSIKLLNPKILFIKRKIFLKNF